MRALLARTADAEAQARAHAELRLGAEAQASLACEQGAQTEEKARWLHAQLSRAEEGRAAAEKREELVGAEASTLALRMGLFQRCCAADASVQALAGAVGRRDIPLHKMQKREEALRKQARAHRDRYQRGASRRA